MLNLIQAKDFLRNQKGIFGVSRMAFSKKELGLMIKHLRKMANLTQEELGKKMNPKTRKAQISKIETGKANYTIDYLFEIANALNCDISNFFASKDGHKSAKIIIIEGIDNVEEIKRALQK